MLLLSPGRLALLTILMVFCTAQVSSAKINSDPWIVSPELLQQEKLKLVWQKNLPIQQNEKLESLLGRLPEGDMLVSLESQLIRGLPFVFLSYPHGFIHRPKNMTDERYQIMKNFILKGKIGGVIYT